MSIISGENIYVQGGKKLNNNKNRHRDSDVSNAELRKMEPKDNADVGIKNGKKIGNREDKMQPS